GDGARTDVVSGGGGRGGDDRSRDRHGRWPVRLHAHPASDAGRRPLDRRRGLARVRELPRNAHRCRHGDRGAYASAAGAARGAAHDRSRDAGDGVRLVACYGAFGFGYIVPATFLPVMARGADADPAVFGWAWPVFGVTAAASTFTAAGLSSSLGNRRLWALGHSVMALGVVLP